MRGFRPIVLLIIGAMLLPPPSAGAAPAAPASGYQARSQGSGAIELAGNVVHRETTGVRAAGADLQALVADRYIVSFTADVTDAVTTADRLARSLGFEPVMIYTGNRPGFAARLSAEQVASLNRRSVVASVVADEIVPLPRSVSMPTGVSRIGTLANKTARINGTDERVNADVAVLDSGIDFGHPDLNVHAWYDCTSPAGEGWDDDGHGTHVAGTIGALDDGAGVVGVAPGARIWSIKIFTSEGALRSWIQCGLQVLADNGGQIEVANLSWGWYESGADASRCGTSTTTVVHQLICDAYNKGVTIVNAAGNDDRDASASVPTTYDQVIAVSALADSDGKIGGKGPATRWGADDAFATFSNYGADIDLAAPGVDILSTCPLYLSCNAGNGAAIESGTSMSAPHVAGAAALYVARHGRVGPAQVRAGLRGISDPVGMAGDPDGIREPVLYVGSLAPACTLDATSGVPGAGVSVSCSNFRAEETIAVTWDSTSGTRLGSIATTSRGNGKRAVTVPNATRGTHKLVMRGSISRRTVEVAFRVRADMTIAPASGPGGAGVTLQLTGFGRNESVTVTLDPGRSTQRTLRSGVTTAANGSATLSVTIPATVSPGSRRIEARGSGGSKVTRTFVVTVTTAAVEPAEATPTPEPVPSAEPSPAASETSTPEPTATPTPEPTLEPTPEPTSEPTPPADPTAAPEPEPTPAA